MPAEEGGTNLATFEDASKTQLVKNYLNKNAAIQARLELHKGKLLNVLRRAGRINEEEAWSSIKRVGEIYSGREARKATTEAGRSRFQRLERLTKELLHLIGEPGSDDWSELRLAYFQKRVWLAPGDRNKTIKELWARRDINKTCFIPKGVDGELRRTIKLIRALQDLGASFQRSAHRPGGSSTYLAMLIGGLAELFEQYTHVKAEPGKRGRFRDFVSEFLAAIDKPLGDETLDKILRKSISEIN
jgi:hypothetical protein